jgi:lipid-A-disaccharide synthase
LSSLLVVAGEASGDRAAAAVVARLPGVDAFGLGGPALASRGMTLAYDLRASTALGVGEAGMRAWGVLRAWGAVVHATRRRKPRAALLVNYTEFNARLAPHLRDAGVRVLWYGAPQVWAWRGERTVSLRRCIDRLAVLLPFEAPLWRAAGVDAHYVGHPALELTPLDRDTARRALGMTPYAATVGVLPGSRPHEVRRLLVPMLDGYEVVRADRASVDARVLVAPSLDESTRRWLRDLCAARRVGTFDVDPHVGAMGVLRAFDAALCASGTASLEAALARAVPVVAYRVGVTTELAARMMVTAPHVALPNILLGRRAFAELLQRDAEAPRIALALEDALDRREELVAACDEVEAALGDERTPSVSVARMLAPWLGVRAHAA